MHMLHEKERKKKKGRNRKISDYKVATVIDMEEFIFF